MCQNGFGIFSGTYNHYDFVTESIHLRNLSKKTIGTIKAEVVVVFVLNGGGERFATRQGETELWPLWLSSSG